jgi:hypothetical protein
MLGNVQPSSSMPINYRKAFLTAHGKVFTCVVYVRLIICCSVALLVLRDSRPPSSFVYTPSPFSRVLLAITGTSTCAHRSHFLAFNFSQPNTHGSTELQQRRRQISILSDHSLRVEVAAVRDKQICLTLVFFDGQSSFFLFRHYMLLRRGKVLVRRRNASRTPHGGFVASCSSSVYPFQTQHLRTQHLLPTQYLPTQRVRFNRDPAYVQMCSFRHLTINIVT